MSRVSAFLPEDLHAYVVTHSTPEDETLRWLAERTAELGGVAQMQIPAEQGAFLQLLTSALGTRLAVEIGTFTGYSSVCIARGLPPGGRLVCFDTSEEWTAIAIEAWRRAGISDRVELRLGPAAEKLLTLDGDGPVDLAFLDADKTGYPAYLELLHPRLRQSGLLLVDNTFAMGRVVDPSADAPDVLAIRAFNDAVVADPRWECVLLPVADGLTLLRKR
jgi:caffeoyl-CoA O-methyltransferase